MKTWSDEEKDERNPFTEESYRTGIEELAEK